MQPSIATQFTMVYINRWKWSWYN